MFIEAHTYVPKWLARQITSENLVPRRPSIVMQDDHVVSPHAIALMLEFRDPNLPHILASWFANGAPEVQVKTQEDLAKPLKQVLVRFPHMIVNAEARYLEHVHIDGDEVPWMQEQFGAQEFVSTSLEHGEVIICRFDEYALVLHGKPFEIEWPDRLDSWQV